jgi:PAS domain S-box-containing protein
MFRLAFDACPNGVIVTKGDGTIVAVNQEIERLFGYQRDELYGQPVEILLPEKSRCQHAVHRQGFMILPHPRRLGTGRDFSGRRKDASEFPIEVGVTLVQSGNDVLVLSSVVDIGQRTRLTQMQDDAVSTVSHELRTPLTSITASLALLSGTVIGSLPDGAARLLAIANANCQRLGRLVNDLLDIKKLDAGQTQFSIQPFDERILLENAIEANRAMAESRGVRIRFDVAAEVLCVQVDPDRFIQVATNLLANAIQFSPRDQEVVVAVERRGAKVHVAISDHGCGIPAEFKAHLFERFAQAHGQAARSGGTGLGLSIARTIVERMGGEIGYEDTAGGGSTFYFDFPCDGSAPGKAQAAGADAVTPVAVAE